MRTAVVFYSLDGNCAFVAEEIKTVLNADLFRLQLKNGKKRGKAGNMIRGCLMVFSGKKPPLKPYSFDPAAYDLIVIGAPVWAGRPAPVLRAFFSETKITGKKTALFVCHGGGMGKALERFKSMVSGNEIIAITGFNSPAKCGCGEMKKQIADWAKTLNG